MATIDDDEPTGLFSRLSVWIVIGILVTTGVIFGLLSTVLKPSPLELTSNIDIISLDGPNFTPFVPEESTAFLDGLPASTMTYGLTGAEALTWSDRGQWPARTAEAWLLTYSDGAEGTMTVHAYQHYSEEDAISGFEGEIGLWESELLAAQEAAAAESGAEATPEPSPTASASPEPEPVLFEPTPVFVGDTQVGEMVRRERAVTETTVDEETGEETQTTYDVVEVLWRNSTGVFLMTGPRAVTDVLYLEYSV